MRNRNERGIYIIILAIGIAALLMCVGLALDVGRAYLQKSELERLVDSAALAAASQFPAGLPAAQAAANNLALMNGSSAVLTVTQVTTKDALGNNVTGVQVSATGRTPTLFMRAAHGIKIGPEVDYLNVAASAIAAPGGAFDLILNLDDTGSMSSGGWLTPAKNGAKSLINAMVPVSATTTSPTKISLVPFHGCYNATGAGGCVDTREYASGDFLSLSNNNTNLNSSVNALLGVGGSGTNNCEGLTQSRLKLFQSGFANPKARKILILLTDATSSYDTGSPAEIAACKPSNSANDNDEIDLATYKVAQDIKNGTNVGTTGQILGQSVEIFVLLYGYSGAVPAVCVPPTVGATSWNTSPVNLATCIATSAGNLFLSPTPASIQTVFQQIISRLPVRIVK